MERNKNNITFSISYIKLSREIERYDPDIINIMTEGPLGIMASIHCNINGRLYTTMRCSRFDLYLEHYICKPVGILCRMFLDWFHSWSHCCITFSFNGKTFKTK